MTPDEVSEKLCQEFVGEMDSVTLAEGISMRDAARVCREIASEFRERANCLDEEAAVADVAAEDAEEAADLPD